MQIYCGSEAFTKPRTIKWKGVKGDLNPLINRRIYFSLQYYKLPMFSSILFKIKHLKYSKNYELISHETVAWANFRLFDHNRRLKTGKINYLSRVCIKLVYGSLNFRMIPTIVG